MRKHNPSIEFLELYAVVVGVVNWISRFKNSRVVLFCDNTSVVAMINKNSSSCSRCLNLIRILVLESMLQNVRVYAKYVPSKQNKMADCLSRLKICSFLRIARKFNMDAEPTAVPNILWPLEKVWTI